MSGSLNMSIRQEEARDVADIRELVDVAFKPMWFSDGTEAELVDKLRSAGDLYLSLVAVTGINQIIGHVGFSPTTIDGLDYGWLQMAPVSVLPDYQLKGVGSALIQAGISALITRGVAGVAVVGNPVYYERFGFRNIPGLEPLIPSDAPYFRAQSLFGPEPQGRLRYAPAFD